MKGDYLVPYIQKHGLNTRSQDLSSAYEVNSSFYLISPKELRAYHSFESAKTVPLFIESPKESLDIDTEWDFRLAEFVLLNQS
jgi:CMP-N,N'-diacetyllegionaminic acid synthase